MQIGNMRGVVFQCVWLAGAFGWLVAQEPMRQELPTNFAPAELLKPAIQEVLSPDGRFVLLPEKGTVLVIDRMDRIAAAGEAIAGLEFPPPQLELSVGARNGGRIRPVPLAPGNDPFSNTTRIRSGRDIPFPTAFGAPTVIFNPNGSYVVIPAHPTRFETRNLGVTSTTRSFANPDGSITVNMDYEDVEFAGFINYGSPILPFGTASVIPLQNRLPRPLLLGPFLNNGTVQLPVFDTTRVSTSIVVYPQAEGNRLHLHLMPQVLIQEENSTAEPLLHPFRQFRTQVRMENGKLTTLRGFDNAPPRFNEIFFGDEEHPDGQAELVLKPRVIPGTP